MEGLERLDKQSADKTQIHFWGKEVCLLLLILELYDKVIHSLPPLCYTPLLVHVVRMYRRAIISKCKAIHKHILVAVLLKMAGDMKRHNSSNLGFFWIANSYLHSVFQELGKFRYNLAVFTCEEVDIEGSHCSLIFMLSKNVSSETPLQ